MGQRHQVYLRVKNKNNDKTEVIGLHHQWLYGYTAVRLLRNYLTFVGASDSSKAAATDYNPTKVLEGAYSFDPDRGYHHGVHAGEDMKREAQDPRMGDNNNGITVIDLLDPDNPKYCFMSVGHLECLHDSVQHPGDIQDNQELFYENFIPIDAEQWMKLHYGKNWKVEFRDSGDADDLQLLKDITEWLDFLNNFKVLGVQDCGEIFPDMIDDVKGRGLYVKENSIQFICDDKAFRLKSTTKIKKKVGKKGKKNTKKTRKSTKKTESNLVFA